MLVKFAPTNILSDLKENKKNLTKIIKIIHLEIRKKLKTMSLHGQSKDAFSKMQIGAWQYDVIESGFKCNMTDIQASMGLVELARYQENQNTRRKHYIIASNMPAYVCTR